MESLRGHAADRAGAACGSARLQLAVDLDMDTVVDALVDAIERDRRHVRMPKRNALFPILTESPRRMTELLLTGVERLRRSPMTIPRTVDDLTPEWCSEALGRTITRRRTDAARRRRRAGRPALPPRARRSRRRRRRSSPSSRRRPTRARSSRPCSTCTGARPASTPSCRRARRSGTRRATTPRTIPRRRTRCCCSKTCRRAAACSTRSPVLGRGRAAGDPHAWPSCTRASGTTPTLDDATGCSCARATTRIPGAVAFAYETAWPRVQEFFADQITPEVKAFGDALRRADPGAVREAVGAAARARRTATGGSTTSSSRPTTT